jgi:two-component system, NarL family, response regulator NreC
MTSIVLADDHHVLRQALRLLLAAEPDLQVVGETGDGLDATRLVERLSPDVLVLDLMMPGLNGLEVTRQVRERCPATRVVVLSMHANEAYVLEALRNGATGFILKDASAAEFLAGVRAVASGRRYLSPPLSDRALDAYAQMAASSVMDTYELLTAREREVLHLTAEGLSTNEIAERLTISPRTAETHRENFMRKLGLHNHAELIRFAVKRGLVE